MSSGVQLDGRVKEEYQKVKTGKKNPYVIFRISDDLRSIEVERLGEQGETFDDFRQKMVDAAKAGHGRYAVYDMTEDQDEGSKHKTGTLVFIVWISDDDCKIKEKMLYTSSKNVIKQACEGCYKEVQINDEAELTLPGIKERIGK